MSNYDQKLLTESESVRLQELESTIARGKQTFVEVGLALTKIRDERLYRTEYGSFAEYCEARWGWSKTHSNRLIDAANVVANLPVTPIGVKVETESQARELAKVEPEKRVEVLEEAAKSGKVT